MVNDGTVEVIVDDKNSVEINVSQKKQWSGKIKVYKSNINIAFEEALIKAEQLEQLITKKNNR